MHSSYLQMYLGSELIDEVHLNYSGLQSNEEQKWYQQGAVQDLYERHEVLILCSNTEPSFLINPVSNSTEAESV